jgi:hypothetical protein
MGKKMPVTLMMEGKFSGEGIHSLESDDDMMSAMAHELVERGCVGESAEAVWADLKRERAQHMSALPIVSQTAPGEKDDPSFVDQLTKLRALLLRQPKVRGRSRSARA